MADYYSNSPIPREFWERYVRACEAHGFTEHDRLNAWLDTEYLDFRMKCVVYRNNAKLRAEVAALYQGAA